MALAKDKIFTFGFNSAAEIYEKLEKNQNSKDECFNFSVTAWQLYDDWIENDDSISDLAEKKHNNAKSHMSDMMLGLAAVANSSKHIYLWQKLRDKPSFNVVEVIYEDVTNWYEYFYSQFPTIITKTAKYHLWTVKDILIDYFEWIFDETNIKDKLNGCIS